MWLMRFKKSSIKSYCPCTVIGYSIFSTSSGLVAILGYPRELLEEEAGHIIEFAELEDFVDVPIKNYSSGMITRLGFAIATVTIPDILIVDEILSVGDFKFQNKCEERIQEMRDRGTTLLLVSHSTEQVKRICNRAVLLRKGNMLLEDDVNTVCNIYTKM